MLERRVKKTDCPTSAEIELQQWGSPQRGQSLTELACNTFNKYCIFEVTKAEIIWCFETVKTCSVIRSAAADASLFVPMFRDSAEEIDACVTGRLSNEPKVLEPV